MPLSNVISHGLGSPASIEHFVTLGLEARVNVLLTDGETDYTYPPATTTPAPLVAAPPEAVPTLTSEVAASDPTYTYSA